MKRTIINVAAFLMMNIANAQVQVLSDPSMEVSGAANNGVWTSTSTSYGTTWCDVVNCGTGSGPMIPRTGTYYSWFGGTPDLEVGTLTQTFNVANGGGAELKFWYVVPLRDATDIFEASIDGTTVYSLEATGTPFTTYIEKTISLGNLSSGSHTIKFYSKKTGGHQHNLGLDDVTLNVTNALSTENIGISSGFTIYTNSAERNIMIRNRSKEKNASISLYDSSGKLIIQNFYDLSNTIEISTSSLKAGMYILKIKTENESIDKKIIVK